MTVRTLRSDDIYRRITDAAPNKRDDIFRYELMSPFQRKWDCYRIPLKAKVEGGYDIIMASRMTGLLTPSKMTDDTPRQIDMLSDDALWERCTRAVERSLSQFEQEGIDIPLKEYLFTLLLADGDNPYTIMNEGYCGDGGIPGFIRAWLIPDGYTLSRVHAALAHETNHNVRFQFQKWHDDITLGEMMVSEGLAENFAVSIYGEELAGPWVKKTELSTLDSIKGELRRNLDVQGLENLNAYLYGDDMAALQGLAPVGMPYCAGYACGYHLIRYFLKKTGMTVTQATILPSEEILSESEGFWNG
ncbi:MAG: DUF2268 domain-containing protein [Oscillospiraceae bacterium]|nr:DUF2268 domain-containing protein [Oscillospiraceae bacterium]